MERRGSGLSRRSFMLGAAGVGLLAGCGRWPWQAPEPARVPRIGYLGTSSRESRTPLPPGEAPLIDAFRQGMRDHGYVEDQNIIMEWRFAGDTRLADFAVELVQRPVDLTVAGGPVATQAAKDATSTTPIIMASGGPDPVGQGLVTSLARPDGNVTGLATAPLDLVTGKQLELLRDTVPGLSRVAVLWDANWSPFPPVYDAPAQALRLELLPLAVRGPDELDGAFDTATKRRVDGLVNPGLPMFGVHERQIVDLVARSRLPAIAPFRTFPEAGGLMAYGPSLPEQFRRAAYYVDRILKGANPAELPVEQPMRFELVVNMKTAQALGITIPEQVLLQVTDVIQ